MKILIDHHSPFFLAHGGVQTQIEQTRAGLEAAGVEVEYLRWWDDQQQGDIIHYFGRPDSAYINFAHQKKIRVVLAQLLTEQGSRPAWKHWLHRIALKGIETLLPPRFTGSLATRVYQAADAAVALTPWEAQLMQKLYGALPQKTHIVANGVEGVFLDSLPRPRGKWLVCTATVVERKRVLELAQGAIEAQTPIWIIGKPYSENAPYFAAFQRLAAAHPDIVRYEGAISERTLMAQIYREARGFVLLSTMESLSLSALEAAACECPILLSDLPWARVTFGKTAQYCPITTPQLTAKHLRAFYDAAPQLPPPPRPASWLQIGQELKAIYEGLLETSR